MDGSKSTYKGFILISGVIPKKKSFIFLGRELKSYYEARFLHGCITSNCFYKGKHAICTHINVKSVVGQEFQKPLVKVEVAALTTVFQASNGAFTNKTP